MNVIGYTRPLRAGYHTKFFFVLDEMTQAQSEAVVAPILNRAISYIIIGNSMRPIDGPTCACIGVVIFDRGVPPDRLRQEMGAGVHLLQPLAHADWPTDLIQIVRNTGDYTQSGSIPIEYD